MAGRRIVVAAWLLLVGLAWVAVPALIVAASPAPSPVLGADTRSAGEGPGFVGNPGTAILVVLAISLLSVLGTLLYVRISGGPRRSDR